MSNKNYPGNESFTITLIKRFSVDFSADSAFADSIICEKLDTITETKV